MPRPSPRIVPSGRVERPGIAGGRQGRGLAEAHVHEDVVERIDAAGEDHVAAAGGQFEHSEVHGPQRAGAGGVDHAVGAAQVEAVGDPAGDHVAEQPGERVFLPADIGLGDSLDDVLGRGAIDPGLIQGAPPDGMTQPGAQGDHQLERAGHPQDHADPVTVERPTGPVTRVAERLRAPPSDREAGTCRSPRSHGVRCRNRARGKSTGLRKPPRRA